MKSLRSIVRAALLALLLCALFCLLGCKAHKDDAGENVVRVYVAHNEKQYTAAVKEFQERTGIQVLIVSAGTGDCLQRIASEADDPQCDVMWGGTVESLEAYVAYFQPYVCAEDAYIPEQFKDPNDRWIGESQQPAVIMYNRNLVADSEIPVVWEDLLDPKWKGQIASADPASSGSAYTLLCNMILAVSKQADKSDGWAFVTALFDNAVISGGSSTVYQGVANGEYALGLTLEQLACPYVLENPDGVGMIYPADGSSNVPDGVALVKGCPHEENARLFIDFLLSADCQQFMSDEFDRRSVRSDIPQPASLPDLNSIYFIDYDYEWAGVGKEAVLRQWQTVLEQMKQ
ncbi:MAG: ABC transporter substrate-binding protein [Clostridiaceae bacterium]